MTNPAQPTIEVSPPQVGSPRVAKHDLTFRFRLLTVKGQPHSESPEGYRAVSAADDVMYVQLPKRVQGWSFIDHYEVECERLEAYQPEYGHDDALPEGTALYDITVGAGKELPAMQAEVNDENPLSVEFLVREIPRVLLEIYAEQGVVMELHDVQYFKELVSHAKGTIVLR